MELKKKKLIELLRYVAEELICTPCGMEISCDDCRIGDIVVILDNINEKGLTKMPESEQGSEGGGTMKCKKKEALEATRKAWEPYREAPEVLEAQETYRKSLEAYRKALAKGYNEAREAQEAYWKAWKAECTCGECDSEGRVE